MRSQIALAALAILTAAACGKKEKAAQAPDAAAPEAAESDASVAAPSEAAEAPAGFPKPTASYKAVYQADMDEAGVKDITMEVGGGKKLRFEMPHMDAGKAAEGQKLVGVFDDVANRSLMYVEGPGAAPVAVVIPTNEDMFDTFLDWAAEDPSTLTRVGSDNIAGMNCEIWEAPGEGDDPARQACLTRDGIILRGGDVGDSTPDLLARSVDKGAVNAARFGVPQGFEVIDLAPCQELMQGAAAAAQSGKMPDMAAMSNCQALAMKAAAVFGGLQD